LKDGAVADFSIFWGDTHDNIFSSYPLPASLTGIFRTAASHLDFYAPAYYTAKAAAFRPGGHVFERSGSSRLVLEVWANRDELDRERTDAEKKSGTA